MTKPIERAYLCKIMKQQEEIEKGIDRPGSAMNEFDAKPAMLWLDCLT